MFFVSRDVVFKEHLFPFGQTSSKEPDPFLDISHVKENNTDPTLPHHYDEIHSDPVVTNENIVIDETSSMPIDDVIHDTTTT